MMTKGGTDRVPAAGEVQDEVETSRRLPCRAHEVISALGVAFFIIAGTQLYLAGFLGLPGNAFEPMSDLHQLGAAAAFTALAIVLSAGLIYAARSRRIRREHRLSSVTGGLAGLSSGLWAAGILAALHGTPWSFYANQGDAGRYIEWAMDPSLRPPHYPPGGIWLLDLSASILGTSASFALKPLTILVAAATGPLAYFAWRLVAGPLFSLFVGVIAAIPLWDYYLPTRRIVLFLMVPVVVAGLEQLLAQDPSRLDRRTVARTIGLGALAGALLVLYSGWWYWVSLGILPAVALWFGRLWHDGAPARKRRLQLLALYAVPAALITSPYLLPVLFNTGSWPTSLVDEWGPSAERALSTVPSAFLGDTNFTPMLLISVLLFAVVLGHAGKNMLDLVLVSFVVSAVLFRVLLLLRFALSENPGLVQRTAPVIAYLMLVISVRGLQLLMEQVRLAIGIHSDGGARMAQGTMLVGVATAAVLLVITIPAGIGALMPAADGPGRLARVAHETPVPDE